MTTVSLDCQQFFYRKYKEAGILLNEAQQKAVLYTDGPLLLLAAPGSGKTTTIIMKIGYLIEMKKVAPARIKALTFSKSAAADMQQRFQQLFPQLASPSFSTIHSFAFDVARAYLRRQGIDYRIIEGETRETKETSHATSYRNRAAEVTASFSANRSNSHEAVYSFTAGTNTFPHKKQLLRQLYAQMTNDTLSDEQLDELTTYISYIKNKMLQEDQWSNVECNVSQAAVIMQRYEQFKRAVPNMLMLDFDDMLLIAHQALKEDKVLLNEFQSRYDYVLTDESQDTSLVQHQLIAMLAQPHQQLCVVADDDQSIYSWRGAEPEYLLQFKKAYPSASLLYMEHNYRSTSTIVNAAAQFITRNKQRYAKQMFTNNEPGEPIRFVHVANSTEQTRYVVEQAKSKQNLSELAVLYRNNGSSITLMNALDRAGIPYYIKDGDLRFFSHWVVEDILNFMRMSFTDKRVDLLDKIHLKMNGYISKQQMAALKGVHNEEESVFDTLLTQVQLHSYQIEQIKSNKEMFREMKGMPPLPAIRMIRERLGYERALEKICERLGFRKEYLFSILNTLEEIAGELPTMEQFASRLKHLENQMRQATRRRGKQVVTISTLHSAKGLEFDTVLMIDLLEGILPSAHDNRQEQLEEATRLFYVGMTRAKRRLEFITYASRGGEKAQESRFVAALREIVKPKPKPVGAPQPIAKLPLHPNAITERGQLQVQMEIMHTKFGAGVIVELDEERVLIQFAEGHKRLALAPCLQNGLLLLDN